jgi:Tol biopolymer transport system component
MNFKRLASPAVAVALATSVVVGPSSAAIAAGGAGAAGAGPSTKGVIVWTTRADDGSEHLLVARADGSHQHQLTPSIPDTFDIDAQVSPSGAWVAYERDLPDSAEVRMVRPDGTGDHVVDLGCVDPCVVSGTPTWLSSSRIAFVLVSGPFDPVSGAPASAVLWTARPDGTDRRRLSQAGIDGFYEDAYARVSGDGSFLTFQRVRDADGGAALFRMAPDGTGVHQLTPWHLRADVYDLSTAAGGPTKDLIVFESYGRGDPDQTFVDIATVPAGCQPLSDCVAKIRWLTDNGATGRRNANPQWSPDGANLVFTDRPSIDDPNAQIWTMRFNGVERRRISTSPNFDYRPTWGRR